MDTELVMDEVEQALRTVDDLRVMVVGEAPKPPAAYVSYPESINYDNEYGRGSDTMNLQVVVVIGRTNARQTRKDLARFSDGNDTGSIKTALETFTYQQVEVLVVKSVVFDVVRIAAIDYMAGLFNIEATGGGL